MTPTRRTRKTAKEATPQQVVESQSSDDDSSDSGSVTRCVCGESHNVGLMVQCDKCEVWQHCECVGLEEEQIPDHYYCDYCQPNSHHNATRPKRLFDAASNAEEEEGSDNLTWSNTLPGSNSDGDAERQSKRRKKSPSAANDTNSSENSSLTDFSSSSISTASTSITSEKVSPVTERRSRRTKLPAEDEIEEAPKKKNCVSCKRISCSCQSENNKKQLKSHHSSNLHFHSHHSPKTTFAKPNSSSPHMTDEYWDEQGRPTREGSPPAKVRYPHDKMSFADMTKRAKQITEMLLKMQNDLLKQPDTPPLQVTLDDVMNDRYPHSSTCSLSSASTVPIMDECSLLKNFDLMEPTIHHEESSLEVLDRLNRDLLKFQRKFGAIQPAPPPSIATSKTQRLATKR